MATSATISGLYLEFHCSPLALVVVISFSLSSIVHLAYSASVSALNSWPRRPPSLPRYTPFCLSASLNRFLVVLFTSPNICRV